MTMAKPRVCKNAEAGSPHAKRLAQRPGPRCETCWRAQKKATKERAQALRREKVYGLTPEMFEAIWEAQGRVCGACGKPIRQRPCIDHDHSCCPGPVSCGKCVRGILHPDCNRTLIGRFSPAQLIRAARYLMSPPNPGYRGYWPEQGEL